ncbi:MAG: peptide deformylase [Firmicutes bacterium]|nr:peptide deformylase [Bacillota bacterium]
MAILEICRLGAPVLREKAKPVHRLTKRHQKLLKDMAETLYEADGVGLAAPQIGISERIVVIDAGKGLLQLVNPVIVDSEGAQTDVEGCLSIPGVTGYVTRAEDVVVEAVSGEGRPIRIEGHGLLARALQHEIDHLDGILFIDRASGLGQEPVQETAEVKEPENK